MTTTGPTMGELDQQARDLMDSTGMGYERAMVTLQAPQIQRVQAAQRERSPATSAHQMAELTASVNAMFRSFAEAMKQVAANVNNFVQRPEIQRLLASIENAGDEARARAHIHRTAGRPRPRNRKGRRR